MAKDERSKLEITLEKLEKDYGKGTVLSLDSKLRGDYDVISTGSLAFDWKVLGVGGYVKGRMYEIMGWEGAFKTTMCAHAIAECQRRGGKGVYMDGENAVDINYFKSLGVNTHELLLSQISNGEEGFEIALQLINTGEIDLLIIDSDNSFLPKAVIQGEVGDSAIGKKAKLNGSAYPKLKTALVNNNVCVIVISQYREKIGVIYGSPLVTQGGHALKFYSDCRIEIARSAFVKEKGKESDDKGANIGGVVRVKTIKNKTFSPYKTCSFDVIFGQGVDNFGEIIELGIEQDIIQRNGSWYSYGDVKLGQGTASVKALMADNPELYEELKQKVIANIVRI